MKTIYHKSYISIDDIERIEDIFDRKDRAVRKMKRSRPQHDRNRNTEV